MGTEAGMVFQGLLWVTGVGVAAFVLRLVLAAALRRRLSPDLMPAATGADAPLFFLRMAALLGMGAAVPETLGTWRLRTTLGLKLAAAALPVTMLALFAAAGEVPPPVDVLLWPLIAGTVFVTLQIWLYEIRFDAQTITLPRWWFGHTTRTWGDLDQVVTRDPLTMELHFRDGSVIRAHKYVVGHRLLMDFARKAMREV